MWQKTKKKCDRERENENHRTKCQKISEKNKSKFNIQSNKINTVSLVFIDHEGIYVYIYLYANIQLRIWYPFFFSLSSHSLRFDRALEKRLSLVCGI